MKRRLLRVVNGTPDGWYVRYLCPSCGHASRWYTNRVGEWMARLAAATHYLTYGCSMDQPEEGNA